jgi:hypothetical protein
MNDLLELAVDGHGGLHRWRQISRFRARVSITGAIWLNGKPGLLDDVVLYGDTHDQRLTISPFPQPGRCTTWEPHRQYIETAEGVLIAERRDPAISFHATARESPWDEFRMASFAGASSWSYIVAPFLFTRGDFATEETWPWRDDGQVWRTLLVTYPSVRRPQSAADVLLR